ncbi:magnesium/cobalt transporter CorA [Saccharomonospora piscinae]|uniref:Magnesium transport protein CorA n=1 Tax=Saccharomonospora piscinae TaxID=687388 RepID=A0A1V9A010_SACPI|nr:magnesium/cobalt transporter CorA [Saccharomonospora piscinae]OQO90254.1 magnesium and cobalt transport protein CorA [Saccharomonospora piscinae]TLW89668.1 magnesium/cobalt transporter CorA [Saccharomonospora piscinae]
MPAIPTLGQLRSRSNGRVGRRRAAAVPVPPTYVVDCGVYVDGVRQPGEWTHVEAIKEVRERGDGFVWIGLHEPNEEQIQGVADTFGLHELAVEDAVHAHQRPKLERYDDTLFMVFRTVRYVEHDSPTTANEIVESGELMAFLGADFIITVRHGNHAGLAHLRRELDADPERLLPGPASVLHAIADHVVDHFLVVSERIEDDIDAMEAEVFAPRTRVTSEQIYLFKREVLELRRAVLPLATPLRRLSEGYTRLVPDEVRSYFRNVHDHVTTVSERVAAFDELLTTLVDATLGKITLQLNSDMRKITAWAAIVAVPTAIAGIYGMNFDYMPEIHSRYGYPAVIAVILVICLVLYRVFRKKKWL